MVMSSIGAGILLIGGDVDDPGHSPKLLEEHRRPLAELAGVGVSQRVLVLRLGQPRADGDVLRGLHVERDALDPGELVRSRRITLSARVALVCGLERDEYAAVVERVVSRPARPDRRTHCGDGRVLQHDGILQRLLALGHCGEGNVLRRLGDGRGSSRCPAAGKKPLGMIT